MLQELSLDLMPKKLFHDVLAIKHVKHLSISEIRTLDNLAFLTEFTQLIGLKLSYLKHVTSLPNLKQATMLTDISLYELSGLTSVEGIAPCKQLKTFYFSCTTKMQPSDFSVLTHLPKLEKATVGTGSFKKNDTIADMLTQAGIIKATR